MILSQEKLNVIEKKRSNIFNWRGQFTPELVEYLLDSFALASDMTLDPFCGSGTVLLESARRNLHSTGLEINPAAYAMARFITLSNLSVSERKELALSVTSHVEALLGSYFDLPLFEQKPLFRDRYRNLIDFAGDLLSKINTKNGMVFALNALFHAESSGKGELATTIRRSFDVTIQKLNDIPETSAKITADLCDARLAHKGLRESIDLIITSPPYINVFNYHQNYRAIMEVLGFDILKVAASEIGSNRKNRGNRFKTVVQYCLDMEEALASLAHCLKSSGTLILIVGRESNVRGVPFSNSRILLELAENTCSFDREMSHERVFTNRFGKRIKEDIIILKKKSRAPRCESARNVACTHLKGALSGVSGDVAVDIAEAISTVGNICPSPLFSKREII